MSIRSDFKRLVVSNIHNLSADEALEKECDFMYINTDEGKWRANDEEMTILKEFPYDEIKLTIGRVIDSIQRGPNWFDKVIFAVDVWRLSKDGRELTDDAQSEETLEKISNLINDKPND